MNNRFGFAKETTEYSLDGKKRTRKHFDIDNSLVKSTAPGLLGYMIEEAEFDDNGDIKSWKYCTIKDGEIVNDEIDGIHCYMIESYDYIDGSISYKVYDKNLNVINE